MHFAWKFEFNAQWRFWNEKTRGVVVLISWLGLISLKELEKL